MKKREELREETKKEISASHPARPFCTGPSIGNQVDGLPIDLSKDAVSASCILPGRAPNRTISQKNDAVDSFYSLSML